MSKGKVILVTGASSGIGLSIAALFARSGYTVFGTSRKPGKSEAGAAVEMLTLDVRRDDSVQACIQAVLQKAGRLDVLVNNAGYILEGAVAEVTVDEARAQFDTNFFGVMRTVKVTLPIMRTQGSGAIINISSMAGLVAGPPFCGIYSASKYALESYSEHLWREVRPFNIRVALIEPGSINTNLTDNRQEAAEHHAAYAEWRRRAFEVTRQREKHGPPPSLVAQAVLAAVQSKSAKLRYPVGRDAVWIPRLSRALPRQVFDRMLRRAFDLGTMI